MNEYGNLRKRTFHDILFVIESHPLKNLGAGPESEAMAGT